MIDPFTAMKALGISKPTTSLPTVLIQTSSGAMSITAPVEWHERIRIAGENPRAHEHLRIMHQLYCDGYSLLAYDRLRLAEQA